MASETDAELDFARKLHLELNGSGRRTRGAAAPPAKRFKKEGSRQRSEGGKETPSTSRSGSGSGSGSARLVRREGALKRLVKKQPDTDSWHHPSPEHEMGAAEAAVTADQHALEPQASVREDLKEKLSSPPGADVASRLNEACSDSHALELAAKSAITAARSAAVRDAASAQPRIKCFYQGYLYGLSFAPDVLATRYSLAEALKAALSAESIPVCSARELEIVALDGEGNQSQCSPHEADGCWQAVTQSAKRVYISHA